MKKLVFFAALLLPVLFAASCGKKDNPDAPAGPSALSVEIVNAQPLYELPSNQTATLDVVVVAAPATSEAYTINLGVNVPLVSAYNTEKGTSYEMLPIDAFSIVTPQVIITRYGTKSSAGQIRIGGGSVEEGKTYVLPVVVESVKGGTNFELPANEAAFIVVKTVAPSLAGKGTAAEPYLLTSTTDIMIAGSVLKDDDAVYFSLQNDVDFSEIEFGEKNPWTPINPETSGLAEGEVDPALSRKVFFDGNNHTIKNLKNVDGGLFGVLVGKVQNLTIEGCELYAAKNQGGILAGYAGSSDAVSEVVAKNVHVKNCKMTYDFKRGGGLIGYLVGGIVENCDADCSVKDVDQQAGGLIGRIDAGTVRGCHATGDVSVNNYYGGGLIGLVAGPVTIENCYAAGKITYGGNTNYARCGGLIGQVNADSTIENCYATGDVDASIKGHMAGGLIGVIGDDKATTALTVNINKCHATGAVTLHNGQPSGNWAHAGGLVGTISQENTLVNISNCYATGAITVKRYSSGFVGSIFSKPATLNITNSFSTCDLSGITLNTACGIVIGTVASGSTITCKGFVAWNPAGFLFCYPEDAISTNNNYYGAEGTISAQAKALQWDETVWDLSGDNPKLK